MMVYGRTRWKPTRLREHQEGTKTGIITGRSEIGLTRYYTGLAKNTPPAWRLLLKLCEIELSGRPVLCPMARAALGGLWRVQGAQAEMENSKKPRSVTLDSWALPPDAGLPQDISEKKICKM